MKMLLCDKLNMRKCFSNVNRVSVDYNLADEGLSCPWLVRLHTSDLKPRQQQSNLIMKSRRSQDNVNSVIQSVVWALRITAHIQTPIIVLCSALEHFWPSADASSHGLNIRVEKLWSFTDDLQAQMLINLLKMQNVQFITNIDSV